MHDGVPTAVIRAAEARAQGFSWTTAAKDAGWELSGLRSWIRNHRPLWARELGRARREAHDAACDEAVTMLRRQMRAQTDKTVLSAAAALTGRFAPTKTKPAPAAQDDDPDARMDEWLNSLPEADLAKIVQPIDPQVSEEVVE